MSTAKNDRSAWLQGPSACCSVPPERAKRPWRLVLLGAPGVGKGTQAELLCQHTGACHLSTGDIFRAAKANPELCSNAMKDALEYMRRGDLVPDASVLNIIRERTQCLRCYGGFLLDGFPRTIEQAEALAELLRKEDLDLDAVIDYRLPTDEIVSRLSGRRTCAKCKAVYHVATRPPKVQGICDQCGGDVVQREDDRPESIRVRMEAYDRLTTPLTDFYGSKNMLVTIEAHGTPIEVYSRTVDAMKARA